MSIEVASEEFLLSQKDANELLEHIAGEIILYMSLPALLRVYEGVGDFEEVAQTDTNDMNDLLNGIISGHEDSWEKLLRMPARASILNVLNNLPR